MALNIWHLGGLNAAWRDGWNKQVATKMEMQTWPAAEFYGKGLSLVFNNSCSNR